MKKEYGFVDITKLICSYLVCILHMPVFIKHGWWYDTLNFYLLSYLCRIAVPFFFLCSGFFLFKKYDPSISGFSSLVKDYVLKMARLYGLWSVLLFVGDTGHFWYLRALVVSTFLLYCLLRLHFRFPFILFFAVLFYCCGLLFESYFGLLEPYSTVPIVRLTLRVYNEFFGTVKNGVTFGFLFVSIGAFLAQRKKELRFHYSVIGFTVSMLLFFAEVYCLRIFNVSVGHNLSVFQVPATLFLFEMCVSNKTSLPFHFKRIRIASILIYFTHNIIGYFVGAGFDLIHYRVGIPIYNYQIISFKLIGTVIAATLLSLLIERLSRIEKYSWLHYLYS